MEDVYSNQDYRDWFNANIYNLAKSYATKHPLLGMERDDYVQELVAKAWQALPKYDPKKARLSTFAYLWFGSKRHELTRSIGRVTQALGVIASLSDETTEGGCALADCIVAEDPDYPFELDAQEAYSTLSRESAMYYEGYTIGQISHELSEPLSNVQMAIDADLARLRDFYGV